MAGGTPVKLAGEDACEFGPRLAARPTARATFSMALGSVPNGCGTSQRISAVCAIWDPIEMPGIDNQL